jgi:hypothetical protein
MDLAKEDHCDFTATIQIFGQENKTSPIHSHTNNDEKHAT